MEQDTSSTMSSPFWVPNENRRKLRRSYSLLLTSTSFLVLLLVLALVFGLIIIPTLRSFTSNIFKPNAVKHSWDSLNLILVLFAVVCGFLTKNDNNETKTPRFDNYNHQRSFSNPSTPTSWYEGNNRSFNRLRSFGSYPDLRQYSPVTVGDDDRYRFYDDTSLFLRHRRFRVEDDEGFVGSGDVSFSPVRLPEMKPPLSYCMEGVRRNDEETSQTETIEKHVLVEENSQPPPPPPMPAVRKKKRVIASKENAATVASASPVMKSDPEPQPPPPVTRTKAVRRNANSKRTYRAEMTEKLEDDGFIAVNSQPPPPPPSPPPFATERKTDMQVKKKRGSATKEFLTSLKGKKKKQRQRSIENFETLLRNSQPVSQSPPPPPPPPPPSVFHNLLSFNKSKYKTHYHVPMATQKSKLPNKREHSYYSLEDNVNVMMSTGNESPLIPIPPPPPPPPFKLPAWKFRVQGDYVRVDSIGSSRSGSPDFDEAVESPTSQEEEEASQCSNNNSPFAANFEDHVTETASASASAAPLFCPSPDVDTKAQNFIKNFRAGLRIAKMNSMKEKQGIGRSKLSNLGPLQNP